MRRRAGPSSKRWVVPRARLNSQRSLGRRCEWSQASLIFRGSQKTMSHSAKISISGTLAMVPTPKEKIIMMMIPRSAIAHRAIALMAIIRRRRVNVVRLMAMVAFLGRGVWLLPLYHSKN